MSVTFAEEVCVRFPWECDTSNKPFEWTGHLLLFALLPLTPRLPLKGSVRLRLRHLGCSSLVQSGSQAIARAECIG